MARKRRNECQSQQHELRARVSGRPAALYGGVPGHFPRVPNIARPLAREMQPWLPWVLPWAAAAGVSE